MCAILTYAISTKIVKIVLLSLYTYCMYVKTRLTWSYELFKSRLEHKTTLSSETRIRNIEKRTV